MTEGFRINKVGDLRELWKGFHHSFNQEMLPGPYCGLSLLGSRGYQEVQTTLGCAVMKSRAVVLTLECASESSGRFANIGCCLPAQVSNSAGLGLFPDNLPSKSFTWEAVAVLWRPHFENHWSRR